MIKLVINFCTILNTPIHYNWLVTNQLTINQLLTNPWIIINSMHLRYCLKAMSQANNYLCSYHAGTRMRLERRNALNLSLYGAVESVSKLGSRRKPVCG